MDNLTGSESESGAQGGGLGGSVTTDSKKEGKSQPEPITPKLSKIQKKKPDDPFRVIFSMKYETKTNANNIPKYSKELKQEMVNDYYLLSTLSDGKITVEDFCNEIPGAPKSSKTFNGWLDKFPPTYAHCQKLLSHIEFLESRKK